MAPLTLLPPTHPHPYVAGSKDPKSLSSLVKALGLSQERVNADLMTYKGVLSKLEAAKEIMKEFIAREKKVWAGVGERQAWQPWLARLPGSALHRHPLLMHAHARSHGVRARRGGSCLPPDVPCPPARCLPPPFPVSAEA